MKCPQCGVEVPEGSKFCGVCGTTMNAGKRGLIILGGIAVVAIIVTAALFNLKFSSSKTAPIDAMVDFYNDRSTDAEDYYIAQHGSIWGEFKYEEAKLIANLKDEDDWEDDLADALEDEYERLEDRYGDNWVINYEVRKEKELRKSAIRDYQETWENQIESLENAIDDLENDDDYSNDDIDELTDFYEGWIDKLEDMEVTEGYTLELRLIIKGDDDNKDNIEIDTLKINGKWVMNQSPILTENAFTKEDYINDLNEMVDNASSPSDMDMRTPEGKQLKKDLENMMEHPEDATDLLSDYMEHITEFSEAAEAAGVSDDDLAGLN